MSSFLSSVTARAAAAKVNDDLTDRFPGKSEVITDTNDVARENEEER